MKKKIIYCLFFIIAMICILKIYFLSYRLAQVDGISMLPTLQDNQVLAVDRNASYERNDIIVARSEEYGCYIIKRIIGMPYDTIRIYDGSVYINGEKTEENFVPAADGGIAGEKDIILGEDEYFIMGDNRNNSIDSRVFGAVKKEKIIGKVCYSLYPFGKI